MVPSPSAQSRPNQINQASNIINEVGIPSQPKILFEINRLTNRGDPDFDQVATLIRKDVALSAKILKIAGSPMFAAGAQFDCVTDALMILGLDFFKRCVMAAAFEKALSGHGFDMKKFWFHSALISSLCQKLSNRYCPELSEKAYTLGLFHDVGAIVLSKYKPSYNNVIDQAMILDFQSGRKEFDQVGSDHSSVGKIFSQKWALCPNISEAIEFHHDPDYEIHRTGETKQLKGILQLAELLFVFVSNRGISPLAPDETTKAVLNYIQSMFEIGVSEMDQLKGMVHEVLSERF